eukprot:s2275_g2.t1
MLDDISAGQTVLTVDADRSQDLLQSHIASTGSHCRYDAMGQIIVALFRVVELIPLLELGLAMAQRPPLLAGSSSLAALQEVPASGKLAGKRGAERRRVLGDLSNRNWQGGDAGQKPFHESRVPPQTPRRRPFEVFVGGENDSGGTVAVNKARSSLRDPFPAPRMLPRNRTGLDEGDLPEVEHVDLTEDQGSFWQPLWEGGPGDPQILAEGLGKAMELADLEAQWLDHCASNGPADSLLKESRMTRSVCLPHRPSHHSRWISTWTWKADFVRPRLRDATASLLLVTSSRGCEFLLL